MKFDISNKLYKKALERIPLASQTFSKSAMNFVNGASPLFIKKGNGAYTWDVDNNCYIDYMLGLLPVILGHCDKDVDNAIKEQLKNGITFSLSSELEIILAEKLSTHIPCAEKIRFAKNGSDATTAAIRIARAFTGRERVAVCGYHGWHDWYIGTTTRNLGVPESERELTITFPYNAPEYLDKLLNHKNSKFAAVILEPVSSVEPKPGYLEAVKEITHKHGALLIFDEIVTGFRIDIGGAQKYYDVIPDVACFGKAMGNGMPISAVAGKSEIMKVVEDIFFSGTFGGETLSIAASIATIDKIVKENVILKLNETGKALKKEVNKVINDYGLSKYMEIGGPSWKPLIIMHDNNLSGTLFKSVLKQELINNGLLISGSLNLCLPHTERKVIEETLVAWNRALKVIAEFIDSKQPEKFLRGELIKPIFSVRNT